MPILRTGSSPAGGFWIFGTSHPTLAKFLFQLDPWTRFIPCDSFLSRNVYIQGKNTESLFIMLFRGHLGPINVWEISKTITFFFPYACFWAFHNSLIKSVILSGFQAFSVFFGQNWLKITSKDSQKPNFTFQIEQNSLNHYSIRFLEVIWVRKTF